MRGEADERGGGEQTLPAQMRRGRKRSTLQQQKKKKKLCNVGAQLFQVCPHLGLGQWSGWAQSGAAEWF